MRNCKLLSLFLTLTMVFSVLCIPALAYDEDDGNNVTEVVLADNASSKTNEYDEEGIRKFVTRLYDICLSREPDEAGLDGWTQNLINKQATGCSVAYGFVFSPEFQSKDTKNFEYVTYMYDAFFGRDPDADGFTYWVNLLDSGATRESVFCGFANSLEFSNLCKGFGVVRGYHVEGNDFNKNALVNLFVERLYNVVLDRTCDDDGMAGWTLYLVDKTLSGYSVAYGFVFSPEFLNRNLCNDHYTEVLYEAFLGRSSDPQGKAYWISFLNNGSTRKDIFNGFAGSAEFAAICDSYGIEVGNVDTTAGAAFVATGPCSLCEAGVPTTGTSTSSGSTGGNTGTGSVGVSIGEGSTNPSNPTITPFPSQVVDVVSSIPATPAPIQIDELFAVPYVSTYYFDPKPSVNDNIQIPLYLTDYFQSEYLYNDKTKTLDLIYEIDEGGEHVIKNIPLGDYTLTLGKLSEGKHVFSVQVLDKTTGLTSPKIFNDLWVINHATYDITSKQTYTMTTADLRKYNIHNDNSKNASDCISTRDGLNKMFADLAASGYRKVILLNGTYRINGECTQWDQVYYIKIPSNFTVDMNGATFKLDTITSTNSGCIVKMTETVDSHLINGTLEGDRNERQALGLETGGLGEGIMTVVMEGNKYASLDNLTIKNTTGHTVGCGCVWGPRLLLKSYTATAIIDGKEVSRVGCSTSPMTDLTEIINWDKTEDYIYVGHPEGYRGIKGDTPVIYVSFYDKNQQFMETVTGYQYRKMAIPTGAKYARVTLLGSNIATTGYDDTVSIYTKHFENYSEIVNCDFIDTRTTAIAPSAAMSLLIEYCTFTRCGNSITKLCVDYEDGAQECQDMYFRHNTVLEAGNATCTVVSCFGYNHVIEECTNGSFEIRSKVAGAVIRNIDSTNYIAWQLGDQEHGAYGRLTNVKCSTCRIYDNTGNDSCVRFNIKDCVIDCGWIDSEPGKAIFENCIVECLKGGEATFSNCLIKKAEIISNKMYFYNCTFKRDDNSVNYITITSSGVDAYERLFENCTFVGRTELCGKNCLNSATFRNCKFDDVSITASSDPVMDAVVLFENCTMNSTGDTFLKIGPFAYSQDYIKVVFRNCTITHTGKTLIYLYSKPNKNSQIIFEGCKINKSSGELISWESGPNLTELIGGIELTITFRNTPVNQSLGVQQINTDKFKVVYEN